MIGKVLEWAKILLNSAEKFRGHQSKIEELHTQVRNLTSLNQFFMAEMQHMKELEKLEREKLKLEIMNELLRRLPPTPPQLPPPQA